MFPNTNKDAKVNASSSYVSTPEDNLIFLKFHEKTFPKRPKTRKTPEKSRKRGNLAIWGGVYLTIHPYTGDTFDAILSFRSDLYFRRPVIRVVGGPPPFPRPQ